MSELPKRMIQPKMKVRKLSQQDDAPRKQRVSDVSVQDSKRNNAIEDGDLPDQRHEGEVRRQSNAKKNWKDKGGL